MTWCVCVIVCAGNKDFSSPPLNRFMTPYDPKLQPYCALLSTEEMSSSVTFELAICTHCVCEGVCAAQKGKNQ